MRHARNFNPEWGYIAPAPNFLRTACVFVVAAAIGAMASAAVVFSLMDRPVAQTSVAARTLVQPVEPALPTRSAPLVAQLQTQSGARMQPVRRGRKAWPWSRTRVRVLPQAPRRRRSVRQSLPRSPKL